MSVTVAYRKRGQAIWLDTISARLLSTGTLERLVREGTVYGVTSNPTIFMQAIQKNEGDYDARLEELVRDGADAFGIYDDLTRRDIAAGADLFRPLFDASPADGWISLEVLPSLAHDEEGTVREATRLHGLLGRPNVFIKVPATEAGCRAVRQLIGRGIPVNVTLMFNRAHYRAVAEAYVGGVEDLLASGGDPSKVQSVASFFVSRVDTLVDKLLAEKLADDPARLAALQGKAGLANCKVVYQDYLEVFGSERWKALAARGALPQRPLWASTGTKNPAYSDLLYVENLVGPDTVNTIPDKTLDALLHHGRDVGDTVLSGVEEARATLVELAGLGIDVEEVGERLQIEGVVLFEKSYQDLMRTLEERRQTVLLESARTQKIQTMH